VRADDVFDLFVALLASLGALCFEVLKVIFVFDFLGESSGSQRIEGL
jgi:hypothetical protein